MTRNVQTNFRAQDMIGSSTSDDVPSPASAPAPPVNDDQEVPTGTISEVKTWVGDDQERAQAALDVENAKESPRSTLIEWLEGVLADEDDE